MGDVFAADINKRLGGFLIKFWQALNGWKQNSVKKRFYLAVEIIWNSHSSNCDLIIRTHLTFLFQTREPVGPSRMLYDNFIRIQKNIFFGESLSGFWNRKLFWEPHGPKTSTAQFAMQINDKRQLLYLQKALPHPSYNMQIFRTGVPAT